MYSLLSCGVPEGGEEGTSPPPAAGAAPPSEGGELSEPNHPYSFPLSGSVRGSQPFAAKTPRASRDDSDAIAAILTYFDLAAAGAVVVVRIGESPKLKVIRTRPGRQRGGEIEKWGNAVLGDVPPG